MLDGSGLLQILSNPTPETADQFGYSVAVSGDLVVVGAYADDTGATDAGAAYVFDATTGNLLHTLNNPTPAASDYFGRSVAVSGNLVVVGASGDDTGATDAGAAYVFDATTGNLLRTLNNPTPAASDSFGSSVAVSGSTVVVGASGDDTGATDAGAAYVFDASTGNLLRTLNNPTPAASDFFGSSVAVSGSTVVVGAASDDTGATNAGAAYVFDATTGNLLRTLNKSHPGSLGLLWAVGGRVGEPVGRGGKRGRHRRDGCRRGLRLRRHHRQSAPDAQQPHPGSRRTTLGAQWRFRGTRSSWGRIG